MLFLVPFFQQLENILFAKRKLECYNAGRGAGRGSNGCLDHGLFESFPQGEPQTLDKEAGHLRCTEQNKALGIGVRS